MNKESRRINFGEAKPRIIKGNSKDEKLAHFMLSPETQSAVTTKLFLKSTGTDTYCEEGYIVKDHQDKIIATQKGDLSELEAMLVSQSLVLNNIFNETASRAAHNMGEYPKTAHTYMNMALKAQSQCRCTVEAINEIKNPKSVTITRQANIANQQIVNNGDIKTDARAEKKENESNELLSEVKHEKVDSGRTRKAKPVNQTVEAVGKVHRRKNNKGKS